MQKLRTRYAPSPTGVPHIGNIRTALYSYLVAKKSDGDFILRIEDTDQKRLVPESVESIKQSLEFLNLKWDEEYYQSKRLAIYKKALDYLKKNNLAYKDENAWRFKVPKEKRVSWEDGVYGKIAFKTDVIEDFVIIKSDGFPTYHFASVVDDNEMRISHVIRGDEWISSTPKHLLLYEVLNKEPPKFVHLPPILGSGNKKLSKRDGAKSVVEYIEQGFLPEAIINFLALLGWSPKGDREIYTLNELVNEFSIERVNKNSPKFNLEKLSWFNKKYIQKKSVKELAASITKISGIAKKLNSKKLQKIIELTRDRLVSLSDFDSLAKIFVEKGEQKPPTKNKCESAKKAILAITKWESSKIEESIEKFAKENNIESPDIKNTFRLAVFADHTPPIYESLSVLEKDEVIRRIVDAIKIAK